MNILGTTPAQAQPGAHRFRGRDAERILAGELLEAFRAHAQTSTEFMERLAGRLVNHVLLVETAVFDATATPIYRSFKAAAGAIEVSNRGANDITVSAAGPSSSAPPSGVGVYVVAAGTTRVVALASRQVTLYGTAADKLSFQVFTAGPHPGVV